MKPFTLGILSGGRGTRVGGSDKGWLSWQGKPLIQYPLDTFSSLATEIIISANRELPRYLALPARVVTDLRPDFCGPMAGLESIMSATTTWPLMIIGCDMPNLPTTVAEQLISSLSACQPIVVAHDGNRQQHLCMAIADEHSISSLKRYLDDGGRSAYGWLTQNHAAQISFPQSKEAFENVNRLSEGSAAP